MNTEYFPYFCRMNFKELVNEPNELLIELGEHFKEYLQNKFIDNMEILEPIWNINPFNTIIHIGNPLKMNGYHPALLYHFSEFVTKMKNENSID